MSNIPYEKRANECRQKLKNWIDEISDRRAIYLWEDWIEWIRAEHSEDKKSVTNPRSMSKTRPEG